MTGFAAGGHNQGVDDDGGRVLAFPQAPEAIELRHLRSFVAVAEELNFGKAATRLYLSQPALSRQISALERLVGCELLRRSTHRVELTLAGEALLDRARRILGYLDEAVSATQSVGGELIARVTRLWEPLVDAGAADADLQEMRSAYESLHAQFTPPEEVAVRPINAGGVPSLLLTPEPERPVTLLYLHGGGYVLGSAFGYRPLVGALAAAAETGALVPAVCPCARAPVPAGTRGRHARVPVADRPLDGNLRHNHPGRRLLGRRPRPLAADQPQAAGDGDARRRGAVLSRDRPHRGHA